jgi:hypothetical protein
MDCPTADLKMFTYACFTNDALTKDYLQPPTPDHLNKTDKLYGGATNARYANTYPQLPSPGTSTNGANLNHIFLYNNCYKNDS